MEVRGIKYTESLASHSTKHAIGNTVSQRSKGADLVVGSHFSNLPPNGSSVVQDHCQFQDQLRNRYMQLARIWHVSTFFLVSMD
jgi:hypothetical protein